MAVVGRVRHLALILIVVGLLGAPPGEGAPPDEADAQAGDCTASTTFLDDQGAECVVNIPRCTSVCRSYLIEITVEATGPLDGATTPYVTAALGGTQRCSGITTCTTTEGPYPESTVVGIGLPCEGWGADGFVGVHTASSLELTCDRITV